MLISVLARAAEEGMSESEKSELHIDSESRTISHNFNTSHSNM